LATQFIRRHKSLQVRTISFWSAHFTVKRGEKVWLRRSCERTVAISPRREIRTEEMEINMGPQHPSTHGVLRVVIKVDGEWIRAADPDLGYLHRSFEKLAEQRTYPQGIFLTDRGLPFGDEQQLGFTASLWRNCWAFKCPKKPNGFGR